jgi:hypothetical protein
MVGIDQPHSPFQADRTGRSISMKAGIKAAIKGQYFKANSTSL